MDTNVADLLSAAATTEPDKIALSEAATGRAVTWAVLDELADRVAHGLSRLGLVAGYRVMVAMTNQIEFVVAYLGSLRAGMVVVPVNPRGTTGELIRMLVDSGTRLVFTDGATIGTVRGAVAGVGDAMRAAGREQDGHPQLVVVGTHAEDEETHWDTLIAEHRPPSPGRRDPESVAVLLYTSGTSGVPRAAMLSHRALLANVEQVAAVDPPMIVGQDVVLGVLPLFHVYGLNAVLGQVVRQRARLVLVDRFDAESSLNIIEDEAVSVAPVAPPVIAYWMQVPGLEDRLGPLRLVLSGSAPISPDLSAAFTRRTGLSVHQGYGLTEAGPVVTSTVSSPSAHPGSVGRALPGIELRLVDEHGGAPEPDDDGEIWVRGGNLFSGYWPDGADGPDAEGWFATGDVGFLEPDGDLRLVDRLKELVIVSGFNVYPSEVEDVIAELADVAGVAVIGMADEATGEQVVAYVKPVEHADRAVLAEQVREHCAGRLARFKQPAVVHVVDALPYTVTGKVQKGRLRAHERRRATGLLE